MCKIIQFPVQHSNGYKNLVDLFNICDSVGSCNFYLEAAEQLYKDDRITEKELYTLRRIGRTKRLELAKPEPQEAPKADKPGTYCYTPEMGQQKPNCQIEAGLSYYGGHYWIRTPLELKGRGITENEPSQQNKGCRNYTVTKRAFEKLKEQYTISMECCLD